MKKYIIFIILCLMSIPAFFYCIGYRIVYENGYNITNQLETEIIQEYNKKIIIQENDISKEYDYMEIGLTPVIKNKSIFKAPLIDKNNIIIKYEISIDVFLEKLNEDRFETIPGNITISESSFYIDGYRKGNLLDLDKLNNNIQAHLGENIEIHLDDYYMKTQKDEEAILIQNEINNFENLHIMYTNGVFVNAKDYFQYFDTDGQSIYINDKDTLREEIKNYIYDALKSYDTAGGNWDFTTSNGDNIQVSGGNYGNIFSSEKESEYIIEKFSIKESENNRVPIYSQQLGNVIPNTYVEVSIEAQHLWYYQNGKLILETDIVTGLKNKRDTPKGVYQVLEKVNGKYLVGVDYKTWVNKWMRLTWKGIGLHDATWRSKFGGTIYSYDGSHGCINMPKLKAYELYDYLNVGDCVIIY